MAKVLQFPKAARLNAQVAPAQATAARAPCDIIIFPGVRYERWEQKPVKRKRKSRQRKKRTA
jgi:hypothetical protein